MISEKSSEYRLSYGVKVSKAKRSVKFEENQILKAVPEEVARQPTPTSNPEPAQDTSLNSFYSFADKEDSEHAL
jgi:hypothetical protein